MPKFTDITGQRFGRLVAIRPAASNSRGDALWLCRCNCGFEKIIRGTDLRGGYTRSCGCLNQEARKSRALDITGQRFGRLVALYHAHQQNTGEWRWQCECDCGQGTIVNVGSLRAGRIRSCGCLQRERAAEASFKHGASGTPEHDAWISMLQRCNNPNNPNYKDYGGRGIKICERWLQFENFLADMGHRPSPDLSIDRINNDGNYESGNVKWSTRKEQANNTRRTQRC